MSAAVLVSAIVLGATGCTATRTEVLVVFDSDIPVPTRLDQIEVVVSDPDGRRMQTANARLGPGEASLPRTLGLLHTGGPLGPFRVIATARRMGDRVVVREARFDFQPGRTVVLRLDLLDRCRGARCGDGQTCAASGCVSVDVPASELTDWTGALGSVDAGAALDAGMGVDAGGGVDAGLVDAGPSCVPTSERCNGRDDDCDARVDEDFALATDRENCGACGASCGSNEGCVAGRCTCGGSAAGVGEGPACPGTDNRCCGGACTDTTSSVTSCGSCGTMCPSGANVAAPICSGGRCDFSCDVGFGDCNGDADDGCEANLQTDGRNCGECGRRCTGAETCCAGACRPSSAGCP